MALTPEERRRRQAIDRDPANKCKWEGGCGNTARLGEPYCGAHKEEFERYAEEQDAVTTLRTKILSLTAEPFRGILLELLERTERAEPPSDWYYSDDDVDFWSV
jgi:hypothetical protein